MRENWQCRRLFLWTNLKSVLCFSYWSLKEMALCLANYSLKYDAMIACVNRRIGGSDLENQTMA